MACCKDNADAVWSLVSALKGLQQSEHSCVPMSTRPAGKTEYSKGNAYAQVALSTTDVYKTAEQIRAAGVGAMPALCSCTWQQQQQQEQQQQEQQQQQCQRLLSASGLAVCLLHNLRTQLRWLCCCCRPRMGIVRAQYTCGSRVATCAGSQD